MIVLIALLGAVFAVDKWMLQFPLSDTTCSGTPQAIIKLDPADCTPEACPGVLGPEMNINTVEQCTQPDVTGFTMYKQWGDACSSNLMADVYTVLDQCMMQVMGNHYWINSVDPATQTFEALNCTDSACTDCVVWYSIQDGQCYEMSTGAVWLSFDYVGPPVDQWMLQYPSADTTCSGTPQAIVKLPYDTQPCEVETCSVFGNLNIERQCDVPTTDGFAMYSQWNDECEDLMVEAYIREGFCAEQFFGFGYMVGSVEGSTFTMLNCTDDSCADCVPLFVLPDGECVEYETAWFSYDAPAGSGSERVGLMMGLVLCMMLIFLG